MPKNNSFSSRSGLANLLHHGLLEMNLPLSEFTQAQLIRYVDLMGQWNKVYNLTSIRDKDTMVIRHLLDSLSLMNFIEGKSVVDVGTGAGLPGLPLAIAMPDCQFVLLDSNHKKMRFLQQTCYQLRLRNVRVVHQRVEDYKPPILFDTVISRSFSTLQDFLKLSRHLAKPSGQMLAMKGVYPLTELQELPEGFKLVEVTRTEIPNLNAERHIVEFCYMHQKNKVETV